MSDRNRFFTPGSPLEGKPVPPDWNSLSLRGKRLALVNAGLAENWLGACRLLGAHGAAVRKYKRSVAEARAKRGGKFSPED